MCGRVGFWLLCNLSNVNPFKPLQYRNAYRSFVFINLMFYTFIIYLLLLFFFIIIIYLLLIKVIFKLRPIIIIYLFIYFLIFRSTVLFLLTVWKLLVNVVILTDKR